jgi:two-component system phosphate regulon sensor histidine kinase PhoR
LTGTSQKARWETDQLGGRMPVMVKRGFLEERGGIVMDNSERYTAAAGYRTADLQRASDFQAALLGMAGHDLRQPLQVIQRAYEVLRTAGVEKSQQAWLDHGEQAISRLSEQLDRLLGAFRLYEYTKTMELSSVALEPLFHRVCEENEHAALRRGIDLRVCATKARVCSNSVLLGCILGNLITNAIKYTELGGRILIGGRRCGSQVRIDVHDTGIGIAPERLSRIFDAFERCDSSRREGLGIGLFVVRRALDVLGHRIEVRSAVGRGSRFSIIARRSR